MKKNKPTKEMPICTHKVGDVIEFTANGKTERYMATAVGITGFVEMRKVKTCKTKIGNIRFPPIITIRTTANAFPQKNKS